MRYNWKYILGILLIGTVGACQSGETMIESKLPVNPIFKTLENTVAGNSKIVQLAEKKQGEAITACLSNGVWMECHGYEIENGSIVLHESSIRQAGEYQIHLLENGKLMPLAEFRVVPHDSEGIIDSYAFPKSVMPYSKEKLMVVGMLRDLYGNLIHDASTLNFAVLRDGQEVKRINNSDAWQFSMYTPKTPTSYGPIRIGISSENTGSHYEEILVQPGGGENFQLSIESPHLLADGRSFSRITTSVIRDKNNGIISDGTAISFFVMEGDQLMSSSEAVSYNGRATLNLSHPVTPGERTVHGSINGFGFSQKQRIKFEPFVVDVPVVQDKEKLKIGPVISKIGTLLPNGSKFKIQSNNQSSGGELMDGRAEVDLQGYASGTEIKIQIFGTTKRFTIK